MEWLPKWGDIIFRQAAFSLKVLQSSSDMHGMEDLDFIVETVFGHESEAERRTTREKLLSNGNHRWITEFANRLRKLEQEGKRVKE
jgi:hypothetical protein